MVSERLESCKLFLSFILYNTQMKKKILISLIILVIIGFGAYRLFATNTKKVQYQTAQVTKGTLLTTVSESGNVTSGGQAGIGSPTTGIIQDIYVKDGDQVKQGQNLFKVVSTATAQEKASALASYLSAKSALNNANAALFSLQSTMFNKWQIYMNTATNATYQNADLTANTQNRTQTPFEIAQDDWLATEAQYKNQQTVISQAQAAENNALLAYKATQTAVVTAPFSGTVANLTVRAGDQITASGGNLSSNVSSTTATNAVLYIGSYSKPYIKVQAGEVDVPHIHAGQKATITLDAFPNKTFVGNVDQVDTTGAISSGVVTYNVFVSIVAPDPSILPGMSASVTIQTNRKDDVLSVPSSAIQITNGQTSVQVMKNGKVSSVNVTTGLVSDTDTEITSGLSEGDTVVTGTVNAATQATGTSPFARSLGGFGGGGGIRRGGG